MAATLLQGPALYRLGNDRVTVWWETDTVEDPNTLEWWRAGMATRTVVTPTSVSVRDALGEHHIHFAEIEDLPSNTLHYYVIKAPEYESPVKLFTTLKSDGSSVRVGVWGHNEDQPYSSVPGLAATLDYLSSKSIDTYLGTGGYVGDGRFHSDWVSHWLTPFSALSSKGFFGCRGDSDGISLMAQAMLPLSSKSGFRASVSIGKAMVVALTSVSGTPRRDLRPGFDQYEWFLNRIAQSSEWKSALYRIVLVNHPYRTTFWREDCTYGDQGTEKDLEKYLVPILKVCGADLVLHGMSRSYQRGAYLSTHPNNPHTVHHVVTGGGGAPKHSHRCWNWLAPDEPGIVFDSSNYISLVLDISSTRLLLEAHDMEEGEVVDRVVIGPHALY